MTRFAFAAICALSLLFWPLAQRLVVVLLKIAWLYMVTGARG